MMNIKVLGAADASFEATVSLIEETARAKNVAIALEKSADPADFQEFNASATPAVVVNGRLMHSGSVPDKGTVEGWLSAVQECTICCGG